ncbi:hypothetical protein IMSAG025_00502 [Muribaculaceae bacterium]|nr:hypothetical protein IMSAG025_00502 [Muribaculaceae bacterium]
MKSQTLVAVEIVGITLLRLVIALLRLLIDLQSIIEVMTRLARAIIRDEVAEP